MAQSGSAPSPAAAAPTGRPPTVRPRTVHARACARPRPGGPRRPAGRSRGLPRVVECWQLGAGIRHTHRPAGGLLDVVAPRTPPVPVTPRRDPTLAHRCRVVGVRDRRPAPRGDADVVPQHQHPAQQPREDSTARVHRHQVPSRGRGVQATQPHPTPALHLSSERRRTPPAGRANGPPSRSQDRATGAGTDPCPGIRAGSNTDRSVSPVPIRDRSVITRCTSTGCISPRSGRTAAATRCPRRPHPPPDPAVPRPGPARPPRRGSAPTAPRARRRRP